MGQLFMWLQIFYFKPRRENLTEFLFCLDLSLSRSADDRDRNLHQLSHRFQSSLHAGKPMPTTLSFHLSVSMYIFNVKSYT